MEFVSRIQEVDRFEVKTEIWPLRGHADRRIWKSSRRPLHTDRAKKAV